MHIYGSAIVNEDPFWVGGDDWTFRELFI